MTITKKAFYEVPLSIELTGLNALGFARTDLVDNTYFGFEEVYIQLKLRTSNVFNTESSVLQIYFIEANDILGSLTYYRLTRSVPIVVNTSYNTALWFSNMPPFWGIGVYSDISLSTDPSFFGVAAFGVYSQQTEQHFFAHNAMGGILGYTGDATETSFPYIYETEGSLALSNMLPVPLITALGILSFGGIATVVTPFIQVATGRISKSGVASGPSATP